MLFGRIAAFKVEKVSGSNAQIVTNIEKYGHAREIDAISNVKDYPYAISRLKFSWNFVDFLLPFLEKMCYNTIYISDYGLFA